MSGDGRGDLPAEFLDLVDVYCSGLIDDAGVRRLEAILLRHARAHAGISSTYFHHHTEIHFAVRAGRAADAVLGQLASAEDRVATGGAEPTSARRFAGLVGRRRGWGWRPCSRRRRRLVAWAGAGRAGRAGTARGRRAIRPSENVAWLVNAQDCRWDEPGPETGP